MDRLIKAGLVLRKNGKYFLTSLGSVVYEFHILIGVAVENYWKLIAIDSIEASLPEDDLFVKERKRIINALIGRNNIKNILNQNIPSDRNHKISSSSTSTFCNFTTTSEIL
jgi:hypothetical protein